jgi:hydroxymethylglutaryl-CoA lyase
MTNMKIIECPRDAMQGMENFIATPDKVRYLNALLKVGFDTIDFGSFVSPKAIPQMRDTQEVLEQLLWQKSSTKLLAIVANLRGAEAASRHQGITYLGFPLSVSETFQQRNTNSTIAGALNTLNEIQELSLRTGKQLVTYISMGFGNPYGDPYNQEVVHQFIDILVTLGVRIISLADTVGLATPEEVSRMVAGVIPAFPSVEFGVHLHSSPVHAVAKIDAAYQAGCRRFDGALKGFGGCPMANDELVGNLATETILTYLEGTGQPLGLNQNALAASITIADEIFLNH